MQRWLPCAVTHALTIKMNEYANWEISHSLASDTVRLPNILFDITFALTNVHSGFHSHCLKLNGFRVLSHDLDNLNI